MPLTSDDIVAITQRYASYNHAYDYGTAAQLAENWTEDGEMHSPRGVTRGYQQLQLAREQTLTLLPGLRHAALNVVAGEVAGEDDAATGTAYLIAYQAGPDGFKVVVTGRYQDRLAKLHGRWLFSRRELISD